MIIKQGDKFKASLRFGISTDIKVVEGKISFCLLSGRKYLVLCQNDCRGGNDEYRALDFERYGYDFIFILAYGNTVDEVMSKNVYWLAEFSIMPDRKSRLENLEL